MFESIQRIHLLHKIFRDVTLDSLCLPYCVCLLYTPADTQLVYMLDTYHGSSGSPVLLATEGNLVLVAVHRRFSRTDRRFKIGSVVTENFLARL